MEETLKQILARLEVIESKLDENIQVTKALRHNNEEVNAQLHCLGHNLAELTGKVNQLDKKADKLDSRFEQMEMQQDIIKADVMFLARKAIEQDEAMYRLQKAK
ncbi:hypothetical protein SOV_39600 [Sporomusa ovata DSM 2662]|uniref:Chromosome partition protein smc n=1 Tax=Sporomusa ovata TaxID=2378 RepID=A0A0U1KSM8_9FIRM|nr:hypothetical protein [Sporomusa ovata]EQB26347.1 hypothetical protein SOV_3c02210 [Sporomusa ovata DSM 2662]CQR70426.1 hypothetical protein SpAn4DRAFT_1395 [Sporomusa ovata]